MNIYEILAVVLTADVLGAATRWIEHDLKMRRGNRA